MSPNLSGTFAFDEIGECHQLMLEHKHPFGNMGVLVNAPAVGLGATGNKRDAVSA